MTDREMMLERLRSANPLPDRDHVDAEELGLFVSYFEERKAAMHSTPTGKPAKPTKPTRRSWYRRPSMVFAAAVVVTILTVTPLLLLRSTGTGEVADEPIPSATTTPADTATITAVPATTVPPPPSTTVPPNPEAWQRVGTEATDSTYALLDMTRAGSRFIAVGVGIGDETGVPVVILASDDAITWSRLAEDDPALTEGHAWAYGVTAGGSGLVAVGQSGESCVADDPGCDSGSYPTVWLSTDGTSWIRSQVDSDYSGAMEDVAITSHGIVATGWFATPIEDSPDTDAYWVHPAMWLSESGDDWERVFEGDPVVFDPVAAGQYGPDVNRVLALAVGPDGSIVSVGSTENSDGQEVAAVWTSVDARSWEISDVEDPTFGSEAGLDVSMIDVAYGPTGFIAVGNEDAAEIGIWQSPDGRSWSRVETDRQAIDPTGVLSAIAVHNTGWAAAGFGPDWDGGPVTLWTSPDGTSWERGQALDTGWVQQMLVTTDRIVITGAMIEPDNTHGAIWTTPTEATR